MKIVKPVHIKPNMKISELVAQMAESGVMGAGKIAKSVDIMEAMIRDKDCKVFLGMAGAMVPGGMKGIIIEMLRSRYIDVFVTTGANLTHDMIEALGHSHYQGRQDADDEALYRRGIVRMYDSYMPNKSYQDLEDFFEAHFKELEHITEVCGFLWKLGSLLPKGKPSILRTCYEQKIPIFCPALNDSGIGLMIWGQLAKGKKVDVGMFNDLKQILDIAWTAKRAGVIYLGGGVPKNYIQQSMQFSPKSSIYGVQITMDRPEPGGSSGAQLKEGISWGKMNPKAHFVDVACDVTIALPLIYGALKDRLK